MHDQAFGCSIRNSDLSELHIYANKKLCNFNFDENCYDVNFERHALDEDIAPLIEDISQYEYCYGQKNNEPLIYIDSINLKKGDWRVMGQRQDTVAWEKNGIKYIQFNAKRLIEELNQYPEVQLEIIGRASINEWMGVCTPQIIVTDYEVKNGKYAF